MILKLLEVILYFYYLKKGKEISVETWTGSEGASSLGLLDFMTIGI
jgi:hypothetical protein